jgi:hypothetical protein
MVEDLGRTLLLLGAFIFVAGLVLSFAGRIPGLGSLPGDIAIERENFRLYMPCGTMLVISLLLTLVLNIIPRLFR